ncbi:hypothetical protein DFO70_10354 [Cytobacillus firmus]|uniref:Lipoprotein n=2 Tax=Cytobacillus TaxID=2675230 RepID=A0A366JZZ7_CYTFI|nr:MULTISPECIES: hypothetical protein [Cytobacillus]RBP95024.1 hypothetical protein DFO70_10354 [Cytobacillus firmus]TDX43865.1 hypothetical protein DFO72_10467 [Cytobacillus oceanisediminis]
MNKKLICLILTAILAMSMSGCIQGAQDSIVNSHAEALLTKNNELQFRFKINDKILSEEELYKVKVSIHNEKLAAALGTDEFVYGEDTIIDGEYIEVNNEKGNYIFMNPIPLTQDLHVFEIEEMIVNEDAVSVEILNEDEVIARAFLNNFSSQL